MTQAICFRCDANDHLGYGHLARCLTLARELRRRNCDVVFILRPQDETALREVARQQFEILTSCTDDAGLELVDTWPKHIPVVLDIAHRDALARAGYLDDLIRHLRNRRQKTIFLDSMGEDAAALRISEHLDIVISPYLGAEAGQPPCATHWLAGVQYVILPPAFQSPLKQRSMHTEKTLLVTMGGADPWHLTETVLSSLEFLRNTGWAVKVVAGLFFSPDRVEVLREKFPWAQIVEGRSDLIEDYRACDAVVSAAGLTRYEIAALGLPGLLISPSDFCRDYLTSFQRLGLAEVLFAKDLQFSAQLPRALKSLIRQMRKAHVPRLIDGFGCGRVIDAILEMKHDSGV